MPLIQWNDSLSVQVREIDRQHQRLIEMINDLHDAMREQKGNQALGRILDGLVAYTATHFKTEEKYFAQFGYPETIGHKKEHAEFTQEISTFQQSFREAKIALSLKVMTFLSNWLKNHIKGTDKKYVQFFNANGLQ